MNEKYFLNCLFLQVKAEDRGVERAAALAADERVRIASSDTIESLLETDFRLLINDTEYYVKSPPQVSDSFVLIITSTYFTITIQSVSGTNR